ncbi:MAG: hypothetical protein KA098_06295 [Phenylobacterium sp.]|nr:hypothetical protein [Phenylobacterium sp.]
MRCIFCTSSTAGSKSREHILPESLGNTDHWLPPGVVCDGCNNYFAVKVERPLLESTFFTALRQRQDIPNKRGQMPMVKGVFPLARIPVSVQRTPEGLAMSPWCERDSDAFIQTLQIHSSGRIYVPMDGPLDSRLLARFLGKVGVEIMADRLIRAGLATDELLGEPALKAIRRFVRQGDQPRSWPISRRRIYGEDATFGAEGYQVVHEFDLLHCESGEVYAVICIFGEEFAINLGGPSIEGYEARLLAQGGLSPLYKPGELEALSRR